MRAPTARARTVALGLVLATLLFAAPLMTLLVWQPTAARATEATFSPRASTLDDYRQRVIQALDLTAAALPQVAGSATAAEDLAVHVDELLPPVEIVRVNGGEVLVDNSMLRSILETVRAGGTPDTRVREVERMQEHLASLAASVGDGRPVTIGQDPAALKALLDTQNHASDPALARRFSEWVDSIVVWIGEQWGRVTGTPSGALLASVLRWVVIAVLVGLLGFALWKVVQRVRASLASADRAIPSAADILAMGPLEEPLPPDALGYADQLAGDGRFRDAVRALMRGSVRALRHAGWLYRTRARTTAELLYLLADAPAEVVGPMRSMSRGFDRAWYGHRDPGAAGFARSREEYVRLSAALERGDGWADAGGARGRDDTASRDRADVAAPAGAATLAGDSTQAEPPA